MGRYIDAEELIEEVEGIIDSNEKNLKVSPRTKEIYLLGMKHTLDFVKVTPPIDAVEVVRCKDCRYFRPSEITNANFCEWHNDLEIQANDFCNYGERKKKQ